MNVAQRKSVLKLRSRILGIKATLVSMRVIQNFKMSKWKKSSSVKNDGKYKSKTSKDK